MSASRKTQLLVDSAPGSKSAGPEKAAHDRVWSGFLNPTLRVPGNSQFQFPISKWAALIPAVLFVWAAPLSAAELWGFIDRTGKLVIPARFEAASNFSKDNVIAKEAGRGWGLLDRTGKLVAALEFDTIYELSEDLAVVWKNKRAGFIDAQGKLVVPLDFTAAMSFSDGRAGVKIGGEHTFRDRSWGFIDKTGKVVVAPKYYAVGPYCEGLARVATQLNKWGYIDMAGKEVIAPQFGLANDFSEGLAAVSVAEGFMERRYGFINKTGSWVVPPRFFSASAMSRGRAHVHEMPKGGGLIDNTGAYLTGPNNDYASTYPGADFSSGLLPIESSAKKKARGGFIGRSGTFVIPQLFDKVRPFSDGLAQVQKDGAWGFIDPNGNWVIQPQYHNAWSFKHGLAPVAVGPMPPPPGPDDKEDE